MGKITQIQYKEIPNNQYDPLEMSKFYFYNNLLDMGNDYEELYLQQEKRHKRIISELLHGESRRAEIDISSIKKSVVMVY